jgi:hypothetical protein
MGIEQEVAALGQAKGVPFKIPEMRTEAPWGSEALRFNVREPVHQPLLLCVQFSTPEIVGGSVGVGSTQSGSHWISQDRQQPISQGLVLLGQPGSPRAIHFVQTLILQAFEQFGAFASTAVTNVIRPYSCKDSPVDLDISEWLRTGYNQIRTAINNARKTRMGSNRTRVLLSGLRSLMNFLLMCNETTTFSRDVLRCYAAISKVFLTFYKNLNPFSIGISPKYKRPHKLSL